MKITGSRWLLALLFLAACVARGQVTSSTGDLHAEVLRVYNFQPHTLSDAQIAQKSAVLDQFWTKAKSQPQAYVSGLRKELADFSNPPFFLYDGSKLLLSLSNDPADRKVVLSAVSHSDLQDLKGKIRLRPHSIFSGSRHSRCSFLNIP